MQLVPVHIVSSKVVLQVGEAIERHVKSKHRHFFHSTSTNSSLQIHRETWQIGTDEVHLRGALYFLFMLQFMLWGSIFTSMIIAGMLTAKEGVNIANILFSLALVLCGVLAGLS